jgi:hypothetical protein
VIPTTQAQTKIECTDFFVRVGVVALIKTNVGDPLLVDGQRGGEPRNVFSSICLRLVQERRHRQKRRRNCIASSIDATWVNSKQSVVPAERKKNPKD